MGWREIQRDTYRQRRIGTESQIESEIKGEGRVKMYGRGLGLFVFTGS